MTEEPYIIEFVDERGNPIDGINDMVMTKAEYDNLVARAKENGQTLQEFIVAALWDFIEKEQDKGDDNGTDDTTGGDSPE